MSAPPFIGPSTLPYPPRPGLAPDGLHYAPWWQRVSAFLIDFAAVVTAATTLTLPIAALTGSLDDLVAEEPDETALLIFTLALFGIALVGWCAYQIIMIGRWEQTLGKRALDLVVRSEDGSRCGYGRAATRELVGRLLIELVPAFTLLVPAYSCLQASWQERRQTWHDQIAETIVVVDSPRPRRTAEVQVEATPADTSRERLAFQKGSVLMSDNLSVSALGLDALGEVANIGSGHAATALSHLLGTTVDLAVPDARVVPLADATALLGAEEDEVVAVLTPVAGAMEAQVLLMIDLESAANLCRLLGVEPLSEMGMSALCEVGNILTSGYVAAISELTGMTLATAPPMAAVNMLGALVDGTLAMAAAETDDVLMLRTGISIEGDASGIAFSFVTTGALTKLLAGLGID